MAPPPTSRRLRRALAAALGLALGLPLAFALQSGAAERAAMSLAMAGAYRPPPGALAQARAAAAPWLLLAGDFHCHVSPPDLEGAVARTVDETEALARAEGLDFLVLTPHLDAYFFTDDEYRDWAAPAFAAFAADLAARTGPTLLLPGFEYTHRRGHLGLAFGDLPGLLRDLPAARLRQDPGLFVRAWAERGGLVTLNHPLATPVDSPLPGAGRNLSWRPWTSPGAPPPDLAEGGRVAGAVEAYNVVADHLRDRLLLPAGQPGTLEATLARADRESVALGRRLAPLGGSDSHEGWLRATTFVLARERSAAGIREAVAAGRVCVRDPRACSFQARAPGGAWLPVGAALEGPTGVEVRAAGGAVRILRDGAPAAELADGEVGRIAVPPGRCALLRAVVEGGASGPIYVNCPFARLPAGEVRADRG